MELSGTQAEIPIPMSSACVGGHGHGTIQHHHSTNGSPPSLSTDTQEDHHHNHIASPSSAKKRAAVVKYRECLKNHAAAIGRIATDGCGEFMPSGEEGTLEALKCSACGCHRNFHRREAEGDPSCDHLLHPLRGRKLIGYCSARNSLIPRAVMPLGAMQSSESDDIEVGATAARYLHHHLQLPIAIKKRFRTKFTPEQKEKMLGFAEKVGWRLQKQEEGLVQQFCQEIGVKRRVLKVWMHNNKHNLSKRMSLRLQ